MKRIIRVFENQIPNKEYIAISAIIVIFLLSSCKSYELKPEAQNIRALPQTSSLLKSIRNNTGDKNSLFSKCQPIRNIQSEGSSTCQAYSNANVTNRPICQDTHNDILNQASERGANIVFLSEPDYSGTVTGIPYQCDSLEEVFAYQEKLDLEEKKQKEIEEEKRLVELYAQPRNWLICVASEYSNVPPSVTKEMLSKNFRPTAFESQDICADRAWLNNRMAVQFGIECVCNYIKLDRKKVESYYGN